jgi:membrane protein YdbS with pleckstrin-like domain
VNTLTNVNPATTSGPAPEDNRPHRPADDSEEIYFQGSPCMRAEAGKFTVAAIIGLAFIVLPLIFRDRLPGWAIAVSIVIGLIAFIAPVLAQKTIRYRISNYRIDYERGVLSKNIDTLELWHVEDIQFHQSLMDRLAGVGTITVISHDDTTPKLQLHGLPRPRELFDALKQRVIAVKRQRGVIKMDVGS